MCFSIFYGLVHRLFIVRICFAKTHIYNFGTIVYGITYSISHIFIAFISIRHCTNHHNLNVIGNAFLLAGFACTHTRNNTANMGAMYIGRAYYIIIAINALCDICIIIANNKTRIKIGVKLVIVYTFTCAKPGPISFKRLSAVTPFIYILKRLKLRAILRLALAIAVSAGI